MKPNLCLKSTLLSTSSSSLSKCKIRSAIKMLVFNTYCTSTSMRRHQSLLDQIQAACMNKARTHIERQDQPKEDLQRKTNRQRLPIITSCISRALWLYQPQALSGQIDPLSRALDQSLRDRRLKTWTAAPSPLRVVTKSQRFSRYKVKSIRSLSKTTTVCRRMKVWDWFKTCLPRRPLRSHQQVRWSTPSCPCSLLASIKTIRCLNNYLSRLKVV
jgi:hypothetical protein